MPVAMDRRLKAKGSGRLILCKEDMARRGRVPGPLYTGNHGRMLRCEIYALLCGLAQAPWHPWPTMDPRQHMIYEECTRYMGLPTRRSGTHRHGPVGRTSRRCARATPPFSQAARDVGLHGFILRFYSLSAGSVPLHEFSAVWQRAIEL
jgi:hypothetical protein